MKGFLFAVLLVAFVMVSAGAVVSGNVQLVELTPSSEWCTECAHVSGPSNGFAELAEAVLSFGK